MIVAFKGDYLWLSNFWPVTVMYDGLVYPSVEHAYQAAKTTDQVHRSRIAAASTPGRAKRLGNRAPLRPQWDYMKEDVMLALLRQKFQVPELKQHLLDTGEEQLVEGNTWGDTYWGVYRGKGHNRLGVLLMRVRTELRSEGTHSWTIGNVAHQRGWLSP